MFFAQDLAHLLLLHGAPVDALTTDSLTPLHLAAWKNHVALVRLLLEAKASVNRSTPDGPVPLLMAAYVGNVEVVQLLLECPSFCFGIFFVLFVLGSFFLHLLARLPLKKTSGVHLCTSGSAPRTS